jgi:hypothetical protein
MKRTLTILAVLLCAAMAANYFNSRPKNSRPKVLNELDPWQIVSYDHGTITVKHAGKTYKATCQEGKGLYEASGDPGCHKAIGLVGKSILDSVDATMKGELVLPHMNDEAGTLLLWEGDKSEIFQIEEVSAKR